MKKTKTKTLRIERIILILVAIFILLSFRNLVYHFAKERQSKQTRFLWNNDWIEMSDNIYVENSVIYVSKEDVKNILDPTIYYNVGDQELITTYNKHVGVLHLDKKEMWVNDSMIQMQGQLKKIDSKIYLPISDLEIVYDVEIQYAESTNRVIMDSTTQRKSQVIALKDTKIKQSKLPFSIPIEKVSRGDIFVVLESTKGWKKVRTNTGNIGYVKNRFVSEEEILRENWTEEELNENDFEDTSDLFIVTMEQAKITNVSESFKTYTQRSKKIKELYEAVIKQEYKGIYIDFEQIDDRNSFYRFLIELTPKFKESGLKVVVKLNEQLEQEKVNNIVDFTM